MDRHQTSSLILITLALFLLTACTPSSPPETVAMTPQPTVQATIEVATPRARRLQAGELELAADIDAIPAIFARPQLFVSVSAGNEEWPADEPVIGLEINNEARAYPVRLLSLHEIVNDELGGVPVAVTWCPLCYTAMVFDRQIEGRVLTFGVSGYLYRNNLVMYDHQSNTLWSQVLAQGMKGPMRGQLLEMYPALLTTWGAWQQQMPQTTVLSAKQMGLVADEIVDPYAGYYVGGASGLGGGDGGDERLAAKALVVGLRLGNQSRAYAVADVQQAGLIADELAGAAVLLVYVPELQTVLTYRAPTGGDQAWQRTADGLWQQSPNDTLWDLRSGRAVSGANAGTQLERLPASLVFWFAWSDLYPDTDLYTLDQEQSY